MLSCRNNLSWLPNKSHTKHTKVCQNVPGFLERKGGFIASNKRAEAAASYTRVLLGHLSEDPDSTNIMLLSEDSKDAMNVIEIKFKVQGVQV